MSEISEAEERRNADIIARDVQIAQLKKLVKVQVARIKQLEDELARLKSQEG